MYRLSLKVVGLLCVKYLVLVPPSCVQCFSQKVTKVEKNAVCNSAINACHTWPTSSCDTLHSWREDSSFKLRTGQVGKSINPISFFWEFFTTTSLLSAGVLLCGTPTKFTFFLILKRRLLYACNSLNYAREPDEQGIFDLNWFTVIFLKHPLSVSFCPF